MEQHEENKIKEIQEKQRKLVDEIRQLKNKNKNKEEDEGKKETRSLLEEQRAKYAHKRRKKGQYPNEQDVLNKLELFKKSLRTDEEEDNEEEKRNEIKEEEKEEGNKDVLDSIKEMEELNDVANDKSWKKHTLKFEKVRKLKDVWATKGEDDNLITIDPLKNKKEKGDSKKISQHQHRLQARKRLDEW